MNEEVTTVAFQRARRWSYALLGELLERGPAESALAESLPALGEALELTEDERQAEHYRALGLEVFPFRSVYLADRPDTPPVAHDSLIEAASALDVAGEVDHLGAQLRILSLADDGTAAEVLPRILEWLPPFVVALESLDSPLYSSAARTVWALTVAHAEELRLVPNGAHAAPVDGSRWIADESHSLKDIASLLSRPSESGVFLSRSAIRGWASAQNLPRGFGPRLTELQNGFASAAQYEQGPESLAGLAGLLHGWVERYEALADDTAATLWVNTWRDRAVATEALLTRLATIAREET